MWTILAVLLAFIPGSFGYDYSVGGLVASVTAGFLLLLPIIVMFILIVQWRDWYMKRQAKKGRFRVPRRDWTTFKTKAKSIITVVSTPRSERRSDLVRIHDIQGQPEVPSYTLSQPSGEAYTPYARIRTPARYEEKVETMTFEPEEEAVIVADILPDETKQQTIFQPIEHISQSQSSRPYYIETQTEPSDMRTTVVRLGQGEPQQELRQTQQNLRTSHQPEPVHIKAEQLQSTKSGDIFISPIIPFSNASVSDDHTPLIRSTTLRQTHGNEAVMVFQDDDETGTDPADLRNTGVLY